MIEPTSLSESIPGLLIFEVDDMIFCTDIRMITVIQKPEEIEWGGSVNSRDLTKLNFRGEVYNIINFNRMMKLKRKSIVIDSRILLLDVFERKIAFFVDKVNEMLSLDKLFIEKSINYVPAENIDYVSGILNFQNKSCYFPDYARIVKEVFE